MEDTKVVWVWSKDELAPIGSGRRRVQYVTHPRNPRMVKVYPVNYPASYPVVLSRLALESLIVPE